jgi:chorismate synthase
VPIVEAMMALVLLDLAMLHASMSEWRFSKAVDS